MTLKIPLNFLWAIRKESSKTQILWMRWLAYGEELKNPNIISRLIIDTPNCPEIDIVNIYKWGMQHLDDSPFFQKNMEQENKNSELEKKIELLDKRVSFLESKITDRKAKKEPDVESYNEISDVLTYLNEKTGSNYLIKSAKNREHISARLKEGFSVEVMKSVIDKKVKEWAGTQMEKYLRPMTLFNSAKFESYVNQKSENTSSQNINNISNAVDKAKELYGISKD